MNAQSDQSSENQNESTTTPNIYNDNNTNHTDQEKTKETPSAEDLKKEATKFYEISKKYKRERFSKHEIVNFMDKLNRLIL